MRNFAFRETRVILDSAELSGTQRVCVDYDTKVVYTVTSSSICVLDPNTQEVTQQVCLVEEGYLSGDAEKRVVGIQHLPDQMAVCVAISSGDVVLWNTTNNQLECVGSVERGLHAMEWSPDHELVILATGGGTIVMMTRDFDVITEIPVSSAEFGEAEFVSVGWGKKETQFHGSEGKAAATKQAAPVKPAGQLDSNEMHISWRGDGQYFTVSHINPQTGARQYKVWTREGDLHSTSEALDGLEEMISWKPSGALIATSQRRPNKHDIVFFERNGLKHGEFSLPFSPDQVQIRDLMWNTESTVLAVWAEQIKPVNEPASFIQLWTVSNYHWYLKQHLDFSANHSDKISAFCWDPEHGYRLHVVCDGGQYYQLTWSWDVCCSIGDQTNVAVVDGSDLLITPFHSMVVPPPLSAYSLKLPRLISEPVFSCKTSDLLIALSDGTLALYSFNSNDSDIDSSVKIGAAGGSGFLVKCSPPKLQALLSLQWSGDSFNAPFSHWTMLSSDCVLFISCNAMGSASVIHQGQVDGKHLSVRRSIDLPGIVVTTAVSAITNDVAVQLFDGTVHRYSPESGCVSTWLNGRGEQVIWGQQCSSMAVCQLASQEVVIGLTDRFRLFADNTEVASNCTSFAIHDKFFLMTTHSHTCRCISNDTSVEAIATLADGKAHPFDESVRRLERGSRIVCVIPNDTKLVLQMPRGNLEVIHPRALVLSSVRSSLDKIDYKGAFTLMRRHRINMNLLYDHNPNVFIENVSSFINQIQLVSYINLFLTDLQEEDVTITMYTAAYKREGAVPQKHSGSKVDTVCNAVLETLLKKEGEGYLLCVLTAHVKKTKPELDVALQRVKKLKDEGGSGGSTSAEEALKYLLFLVDVNELYDVALGTYDFDLVMMVAQKSQKDPKEYLPFLNGLRELDTHYQHFTIDKHLKRYQLALKNIVKCGSTKFNECLSLVQEFKLYKESLELYSAGSDEYRVLAECYGDHLLDIDVYEEAGIVFSRARLHDKALDAFMKARNWQQCLCEASQLNFSDDKMVELSTKLAGLLKESGRLSEAALLLEQYSNDTEEAIVTLIDANLWDEALRLMHKYKRTDFIVTNLKPSLCSSYSNMLELLSKTSAELEQRTKRLLVVREEKEKKRLEILEGDEFGRRGAESDLFSDTSSATGETGSVISGQTRYSTDSQRSKMSGRSAKNRRKAERKRRSVKEGSAHEDLGLVERLHALYTQTESLKVDVRSLVRALSLFHYDKEATDLQATFSDLLRLLDEKSDDIWLLDNDSLVSQTASLTLGPASTANSLAQAMQLQQLRSQPQADSQLEPHLRFPPKRNKDKAWSLTIAR